MTLQFGPYLALNFKVNFLLVHFEEIPELCSNKVRFLSAKLGDNATSEFEKFDSKEFTSPAHKKELQIIYATINQIGYRGAKEFFFKPEGPAKALPRVTLLMEEQNPDDFGLRLYCILVHEDLVILLNGGIKTNRDPKKCPNVKVHFERAIKIANKLNKGIQEGFIFITEHGIKIDESFDFDI